MADITGSKLNDGLIGTLTDDRILGLDGNDTLLGLAGTDTLDGGKGADLMDGGEGSDIYVVDNIGDIVRDTGTGEGDEVQASISYSLPAATEGLVLTGKAAINGTGNAANNGMMGNSAANRLSGLSGDDVLQGFGGNDTLDGGAGKDIMHGGDGNDVFIVDSALDEVIETKGTDTVFSSASFTLANGIENLVLVGSAISGVGNDLANRITGNGVSNDLNGGAGSDTLDGGDGNDNLSGEAGADLMIGGAGDDMYFVVDKGDRVQESIAGIAGGIDTVAYAGSAPFVLGANLENASVGSSIGSGNALDNVLSSTYPGVKLLGLAGDDTLAAQGQGPNTLDGGAGADIMVGYSIGSGLANELFIVDNGGDVVVGGGGIDEIRTNLSVLEAVADVENYTFTGGAVYFAASIGAANNQLTGSKFADRLICELGNDTLFGGGGNDTLFGGADKDFLVGDAGADSLVGGIGDDMYDVDNVKDVVDELTTDGHDTIIAHISLSLANASILGDVEDLALSQIGSAMNATGNALDNFIFGNGKNNHLDGGAGADTLIGNSGNDTLMVDELDVATGGADTDTVVATGSINFAGVDDIEIYSLSKAAGAISVTTGDNANKITGNESGNIITANDGNDTVDGGDGNDAIDGGLGDDIITGGLGDDLLIGGFGENKINVAMGNDTVESGALVLPAHDVISGFDGNAVAGQDAVRLASLFDGLGIDPGDRAAHVQIVDKGSTVEIHVDTSVAGDGNFDLFVATLQTKDTITIGEDVLV